MRWAMSEKAGRRVFKYELNLYGLTTLYLPLGADLLDVSFQGERLVMWALVVDEDERPTKAREFFAAMTAQQIPTIGDELFYRGTAQMETGDPTLPQFVVHVFEVLRASDP
jgi:hypothetical protein